MLYSERAARENITNFMYLVYGWMSFALAITAGMSYFVANTPAMRNAIFASPGLPIFLLVLQLGLVIALSAMINRISYSTAVALFIVYAATLGVSLSAIFMVYSIESIFSTFIVTAGTFGAMAVYGYVTKTDLTSVGSFAIMALFGLILTSLVNMYFQSASVDYAISLAGVAIFIVLTAFDVQKIKQIAQAHIPDQEMRSKIALLGALTLYLDFINLFLYLLRFLGNRKE